MSFQLSSSLGLTVNSSPPMNLIEKSMLHPQLLNADEYQQIIGFSIVLTTLQEYAAPEDTVAVGYVGQYYRYFCEHYGCYSSLPEAAKPSFQVANFSSVESFMGKAYIISGCQTDYVDV